MGGLNQEEFMYRLTTLSASDFTLMHEAWALGEKERPDDLRGQEILNQILFGGTVWYKIPDHKAWVYVYNVTTGMNADMCLLSLDDTVKKEAFVATAKELMREYDLRRITSYVPAPVTRIQHRLGKVGFEQEGRLKDAGRYDEKFTDLVVLGFYRGEVEKSKVPLTTAAKGKTPRKRVRRSRRKKQEADSGEGKE